MKPQVLTIFVGSEYPFAWMKDESKPDGFASKHQAHYRPRFIFGKLARTSTAICFYLNSSILWDYLSQPKTFTNNMVTFVLYKVHTLINKIDYFYSNKSLLIYEQKQLHR